MANPPVNGKIQGLLRPLSVFQVLFEANLIFRDFSRLSCIFAYAAPNKGTTIFAVFLNLISLVMHPSITEVEVLRVNQYFS